MQVITIANQKGGVGKTRAAVDIGIGLAGKVKKVCLIDEDKEWSTKDSPG